MIDLLAFLGTRDNYEKYRSFIKDNILSKESQLIVKDLKEYYATHTCADVLWPAFASWFFTVVHATLKSEKVEVYQKIFTMLDEHESDEELEEELVKSFLARSAATHIYRIAQDVAEGTTSDIDAVTTVMDAYHDEMHDAASIDSHEAVWDISTIVSTTIGGSGLNWRLEPFNKSLGPLRKGNFIIIGARPDTGKTSLLAAEATFMAPQLPVGKKVLWFNNEEAKGAVQLRIIQAALGLNSEEIQHDSMGSMDEFNRLMGEEGKIVLYDKADLTVKDVKEACKRHDVGLIIFDQLWKVQGVEDATNDVHKMTKLFNFGRECAKEYAPVITVHQADGSAGGQEYLAMEQLYMSKTGAQGEADAIIMMGRSYDAGKEHSRFISVPKNKLTGGVGTIPSMRNMQVEVVIHPEISRFSEGDEV